MHRSHAKQLRAGTHYDWWVCGLLLAAIGIIYGQTLGYALLDYDDSSFVYNCPQVKAGLTAEGFRWAFTDGPFGEWYPLAVLSHMLDCQLFGLNAWGHHLTNVLVHAATSIALFLVLRRMTDEIWPSAFVAAIFAVHPQHVESVAWVAERKDVLSGLFFVLTLGAYLGYVRHGRSLGRYVLVAGLFALALLAKPMVVTLPAVLLLLDFWPLARIGGAIDVPAWTQKLERPGVPWLLWEKLPLAALAAGDCLLTLRTHAGLNARVPASMRVGNAAASCVQYVVQFFYPLDLAAFYPIPAGGLPLWKVMGAVTILVSASVAAVAWRRKAPYCFVGWFWYLGMLSPVLGIVTIGWLAGADRYTYLPGIGLYIALGWGIARVGAGSPAGRRNLGAAAGLVIATLVACSAWQTSFWRDDETLWRHALACTTPNSEAEVGLADALARRGALDEAIPHYQRAVQLATDASPANNLGMALFRQGKVDEAVAQFEKALEIEPDSFRAHANLGVAFSQQSRFDESTKHFRRAVEINPQSVEAGSGLAHELLLEQKFDEARAEFERVVALDPRNVAARNDLALTLQQLGRNDESITQLNAVLEIEPRFLLAHINLANALAARGRIPEAVAHYRTALEIDPSNAFARQRLDTLLRGNAEPAKH